MCYELRILVTNYAEIRSREDGYRNAEHLHEIAIHRCVILDRMGFDSAKHFESNAPSSRARSHFSSLAGLYEFLSEGALEPPSSRRIRQKTVAGSRST